MLTPRDIHEAEFKRVWKGYNPEEVDDFLRRVVGEYETLFKENEKLRGRVDELKGRLQEYSKTEVQIDETLALAKQTAHEAREIARKEAGVTLKQARGEAQEILTAARREARESAQQLDALHLEARRFRSRMKNMMEDFLGRLDEWGEGDVSQTVTSLREVAAASEPSYGGDAGQSPFEA